MTKDTQHISLWAGDGASRSLTEDSSKGAGGRDGIWPWIALLLILVFTAGVRWRLREMPLERDEGEFGYAAQLILHGRAPYDGAYSQKFPGVSYAYAGIFLLLGQSISAIHIGGLSVNCACIVLLFLLVRRFADGYAGVLAAACYSLMTMDEESLGMACHATHFVVLCALAALLLLLRGLDKQKRWLFFLSGLFLGLATLMKQPGAAFTPLAAGWIVVHHFIHRPIRWRPMFVQILLLGIGVVIPIGGTGLALWKAGVLETGWFWTVTYAQKFGTMVPPSQVPTQLSDGFSILTVESYPLWWLAGFCLALMWFTPRRNRLAAFFALLLLFFSFAGTSFGWIYRNHYFILTMPAAAMIVGLGLSAVRGWLRRWSPMIGAIVPAAICLTACIWMGWQERAFLFEMTPVEACHATYSINPFVESIEIAKYIDAHTTPDDRIAVLGSEAQIPFYSKRISATGYMYMYPLMENQPYALKMQKEMAGEIESAHPAYVVLVNVPTSWLMQKKSVPWLLTWANQFLEGYEPVGWVELRPDGWHSVWDDAARNYSPISSIRIEILKRRVDSGFRL